MYSLQVITKDNEHFDINIWDEYALPMKEGFLANAIILRKAVYIAFSDLIKSIYDIDTIIYMCDSKLVVKYTYKLSKDNP